ncbi:hypothetical protein TNCT_674971 [Trichonephila clavata]|uniref:Uncharacterized protein n=1 Tax=Trichonephila clavata TaxID=2740835 RepID=A0A8X6KGQ6_TRICU|nr:hypothetical protein TNCT_674971 [Trichonephila clavata]
MIQWHRISSSESSQGAVLLGHDRNAFVSSDGTHWLDHLRLTAFKYGRCCAFLTTHRYDSGTELWKIRSTGNTIVLIIHQSGDTEAITGLLLLSWCGFTTLGSPR